MVHYIHSHNLDLPLLCVWQTARWINSFVLKRRSLKMWKSIDYLYFKARCGNHLIMLHSSVHNSKILSPSFEHFESPELPMYYVLSCLKWVMSPVMPIYCYLVNLQYKLPDITNISHSQFILYWREVSFKQISSLWFGI